MKFWQGKLGLIWVVVLGAMVCVGMGKPNFVDVEGIIDSMNGTDAHVVCGGSGKCHAIYSAVDQDFRGLFTLESDDYGETWSGYNLVIAFSSASEAFSKAKLACTESMSTCIIGFASSIEPDSFKGLNIFTYRSGSNEWTSKGFQKEPDSKSITDFDLHCRGEGTGACLLTASIAADRNQDHYIESWLTRNAGNSWERVSASRLETSMFENNTFLPGNGKVKCRPDGSRCYMIGALKNVFDGTFGEAEPVVVGAFTLDGQESIQPSFLPVVSSNGSGFQRVNVPDFDCLYSKSICVAVYEVAFPADPASRIMVAVTKDEGNSWEEPSFVGFGVNPTISCVTTSEETSHCAVMFASLDRKSIVSVETFDGVNFSLRNIETPGLRLFDAPSASCFNLASPIFVKCLTAVVSREQNQLPRSFLSFVEETIQLRLATPTSSPTQNPTASPVTSEEFNVDTSPPVEKNNTITFVIIGIGCAAVIPIALVVKAWRKSSSEGKVADAIAIGDPSNPIHTVTPEHNIPEITVVAVPVAEADVEATTTNRRGRFDISSVQLLTKFL